MYGGMMKKRLITRNLALSEDLYNAIKKEAEIEETSVSELLRNLAIVHIKKQERIRKRQQNKEKNEKNERNERLS